MKYGEGELAMSFLNILPKKSSHKEKENQNKINSLQAQIDSNHNAYTDYIYTLSSKRMSPILLFRIAGGVSVEAALAIPLFIFFMVNIIYIINILGFYSSGIAEVQQEARSLSFVCNDINEYGNDTVTSAKLIQVKSLFSLIGFETTPALASMSYKKWNGFCLGGSSNLAQEEEYVYVTEYGSSYHRNRDCSHLKVTIVSVTLDELKSKRNNSGNKYYACEKCGGNGSGILFITPEGDKYHSSSSCSGLKRSIKTVKLSEVEGRSPCGTCGG